MSIPAKLLVPTQIFVHKVLASSLVRDADYLMREHRFKQVPVVDADDKPVGLVTQDQIAHLNAQHGANAPDLDVTAAMNKTAIFHRDMDIFNLLDNLNRPSAILLVDDNGKLANIVTNGDAAAFFRERAEDIILLEFIEKSIRKHLAFHYQGRPDELQTEVDNLSGSFEGNRKKITLSLNQLKHAFIELSGMKGFPIALDDVEMHEVLDSAFPQAKKTTFNNLTLDGFSTILLKKWDVFATDFKYPKKVWENTLITVREVRNKVFHFTGEVTKTERRALGDCAKWLGATLIPSVSHIVPIEEL